MTVEIRNRQARDRSGLGVNPRLLKTLALRALDLAGADANYSLSVVLVNDREITKLNAQYHNAHGPTDVLSFDYGNGHGEVIISTERARVQARRFRTKPGHEVALYIVHGILHLHGYDDITPSDRKRMRAAERKLMKHITQRRMSQEVAEK